MIALVKEGEITSYARPFDDHSVLSANIIALENYKINLMGSRLFALDFESITGVDRVLNDLKKVEYDIKLAKKPAAWNIDLSDREVELNRLLLGTKAIEQTISLAQASQALLSEKASKTGTAESAKTDQVKSYLEYINTFLSNSEIRLQESINHVSQTNLKIADAGKKMSQLKKDADISSTQ